MTPRRPSGRPSPSKLVERWGRVEWRRGDVVVLVYLGSACSCRSDGSELSRLVPRYFVSFHDQVGAHPAFAHLFARYFARSLLLELVRMRRGITILFDFFSNNFAREPTSKGESKYCVSVICKVILEPFAIE